MYKNKGIRIVNANKKVDKDDFAETLNNLMPTLYENIKKQSN